MSATVYSGGGGISSSDVTAARAHVLAGKTALTSDSNDEAATGTLACGNTLQVSKNKSGSTSWTESSVIDAGDSTNTKAVFVSKFHTGGASDGVVEASNDQSTWTTISSTGFYMYRYYRTKVKAESGTSAQSYGYVGVLNLGYVRS